MASHDFQRHFEHEVRVVAQQELHLVEHNKRPGEQATRLAQFLGDMNAMT